MTNTLRSIPGGSVHLVLMQVLTFTTGVNDAIGYLGLDQVFTGNMTGNVVILGMALTGADGFPVVGPALALVGFLVGAAIGGRALKNAAVPWTVATTALLIAVAAVMFGCAALLWASGHDVARTTMVTVTTAAALAMGIQAATARHIAVKDVTTVVVTSTMTGVAADSWFGNGRGGGFARRASAIFLIGLGAAVGALLLRIHAGWGLVLAGSAIALVALAGDVHRRSCRNP